MKKYSFCFILILMLCTSCDDFIFGNMDINYNENPLEYKEVPHSGADAMVDSLQKKAPFGDAMSNPDQDGAFNNWARCLVMFKEGHSHGDEKFHGNYVYPAAPWRQEEFIIVENNSQKFPTVKVEWEKSIQTVFEKKLGIPTPQQPYIRLIGGDKNLWGICLFFLDKDGKLLNDEIYKHSDEYQIFFTISDVDDKGNPYKIEDCRGTWEVGENGKDGKVDEHPVVSPYFEGVDKDENLGHNLFIRRQNATKNLFEYAYRDTWHQNAMADGMREFYNIRLLPPLDATDANSCVSYDKDCVGLKGHINFYYEANEPSSNFRPEIDGRYGSGEKKDTWPFMVKGFSGESVAYSRPSYILPYFYLSVRVMKCQKGKKAYIPKATIANKELDYAGYWDWMKSEKACAPFYNPFWQSKNTTLEVPEWKELIRFNIPIKVYCNRFDSDPTNVSPAEPYYFYLGREIGLTGKQAYDASQNVKTHGFGAFGNWFL